MSYEEIVKIGNEAGLHEGAFWASFNWWEYVLYIGLFLVIFVVSAFLDEWIDDLGITLFSFTVIIMVFLLPIYDSLSKYDAADDLNQKEIAEYKQKHGNPYLYTLPTIEAEVFFMKIDAEAEVTGSVILGTGSINSELLTTITVSYKLNNQGVTETIKLIPDFDLAKGDKPYVSYQELAQDLPHYERGKYNFKIHLPEDYSFTDIK